MSRTYDRETLRAKVRWEGGILDTMEYGIRPDAIEDPELRQAWATALDHYRALQPLLDRIDALLGEPSDDPG